MVGVRGGVTYQFRSLRVFVLASRAIGSMALIGLPRSPSSPSERVVEPAEETEKRSMFLLELRI